MLKGIAGFIAHMKRPISMIPSNGNISTGSMLSIDFGRKEKIFLNRSTIYPPANPAINAPRKPDTAVLSPAIWLNVHPMVAIYPPTNPTASPGLSAMLLAIYPASTGSIKLKAYPPTVLKKAAAAV